MNSTKRCERCDSFRCSDGDWCRGQRVYVVDRNCCTGGNCFTCNAKFNIKLMKRVEQYRGVNRRQAEKTLAGWARYDAQIKEV